MYIFMRVAASGVTMKIPLSVSLSLRLSPIYITFDIKEFYSFTLNFTRSRDSVVGIATGYGLEFVFGHFQEFSQLHRVQTDSGAHPVS
jgi:hypothetical protein